MNIEPTPRGILSAFFRQKYRFLLSLLLVAGAAYAYLAHTVPSYMSEGTILIRFGSSAKPDVSLSERAGAGASDSDQHDLVTSSIGLMKSHDLLQPIVHQIGAARLYPAIAARAKTEAAAEDASVGRLIASDLVIKPDTTSPAIIIKAYNPNPREAADFVGALVAAFTRRQSELFDDPQIAFLTGQLKRASDELAARQEDLAQFKAQHGLTTLEGEMSQLTDERADARTAALQQVTDAQTSLDDLRTKQTELLSTYRPESYAVRRMQGDIHEAEGRLAQRRADLNAASSSAGGSAAVSTTGASGSPGGGPLNAHLNDIDSRISTLEGERSRYNDLTRAVTLAEVDYKNYEAHLADANANQQMRKENITRVSVIDAPRVSGEPARPNKVLVIALATLAALCLGIGVVIGSETLDDTFSNPEQVSKALRLPVMATFGKARRA